jgi:membrane dipeptidase
MTLPGMFSGLNEVQALHRYHSAGFGFVSVTIGNDSVWNPKVVLERLAKVRSEVARESDRFRVVQNASEILQARAEDKLAIAFHLQGTNGLGGDIAWAEKFFHLGITHMLLAYNARNAVADGCAESTDAGLSRFGKSLVREMNRLGMLVDGSHTGYRSTMEAMEISTRPFIFSHANASKLFDHYRNVRDDQIIACAKTGGVIGINGVGAFLSDSGDASAELIYRHIDYMANLAGPAHVGLGLDFITEVAKFAARAANSADSWPSIAGKVPRFDHFAPPEIIGPLTERLCRGGYSDSDIEGIVGKNFLRVFQDCVG